MSTTKTRVSKIANVVVPIGDQDGAIDFYVNKLGLELRADVPFGDKYRWVEVGPAGGETTIALAPPPEGAPAPGNAQTGITLLTGDIEAYHDELAKAGVDVDAEISRMGDPVPPMFWLRDLEGNVLLVIEGPSA